MIKNIATYKDLVAEKQRLNEQLDFQKGIIRADIKEIKHELKPVGFIFSIVKNLTTKDKTNPLLTTGIDVLVDLFLKHIILSRAGWITKLAVPFFVKNYSSHVFGDDKPGIFEKITGLFKRKKAETTEFDPTVEQKQY